MKPSQELLESVPRQTAWGLECCQYQGFWINPAYLEPMLNSQNNFQTNPTDVLLATTPKAGTLWLKALVFAITKRSEYAPTDPNHPLLSTNPHKLVPFLDDLYDSNPNPNLTDIPSPRLFSTHNPYSMLSSSARTSACPIIYLSRDPKDIFVSLWHALNQVVLSSDGSKHFTSLEEGFELFCKGITLLGPIWDHALEYWNASLREPEKVLFLSYKNLKDDTIGQAKKIAAFVGFPFSEEEESRGVIEEITELCSFNSLSNLQVNKDGDYGTDIKEGHNMIIKNKHFFRKGQVGDWKNYITPSMREKLDQVIEQKLLGTGLKFD